LRELILPNQELVGTLDLSGNPNLEKINIANNQLNELRVHGNFSQKLKGIEKQYLVQKHNSQKIHPVKDVTVILLDIGDEPETPGSQDPLPLLSQLNNLVKMWGEIKKSLNHQAYYTSSGGGVYSELATVKPLIAELTNSEAADNTTILVGQKQTDAYNCGVFLIFYIQEILETQQLALNRTYTTQDIADFRQK